MRSLTIQDLVARHPDKFVSGGYLLQEVYSGSKGRMAKLVCARHGEVEQSVRSIHAGTACPECGKEAKGVERKSYESWVEDATFMHEGRYTYTGMERANGYVYLHVVCPTHGEFKSNASNHVHNGAGCPECGKDSTGLSRRKSQEVWRGRAETVHGNKYEVVATEYVGGEAYLQLRCDTHGMFTQRAKDHVRGKGCEPCGHALRGEGNRVPEPEWVERIKAVHGDRYILKHVDYSTNAARLLLECKTHGEFWQAGNDTVGGHGCAKCASCAISKPNLELQTLFEQLGIKVSLEFSVSGRPKFDLLVNDSLLVEYNGNYWHSSQYKENNAHADKQKLGEEAGFRVIQIFSDEWELRRPQVERLLATAIGKSDLPTVSARSCTVAPVDYKVANALYNEWHIQGAPVGGQNLGLYYDGELVAVANYYNALGPSRTLLDDTFELRRYASVKRVRGGLGKLSKAVLKLTKAKSLVSFSDKRLFTGEAYEKAGYRKLYELAPDYAYVERDRRYHKSNYQKSRLVERFGKQACEGKTEKQITEEQGIYRIYDCGKIKWVLSA